MFITKTFTILNTLLLLNSLSSADELFEVTQLSSKSSSFLPGSTIILKNGTYHSKTIDIDTEGTEQNRITIKPEFPGGVIITGESVFSVNGKYTTVANLVFMNGGINRAITLRGSNNRITGFDISYNSADFKYLVGISGPRNRIDHCLFRDLSRKGVWLSVNREKDDVDYAIIDHNTFRNRSNPKNTLNGLETIRVGESDTSLSRSFTLITQNLFEQVVGEVELISTKANEVLITMNTIKDSCGTISLRHGNKCIVANNLLTNQPSMGGIRISGEDHIIVDNLIQYVIGDNNARAGVSINNGIKNSPLNGYFQVKNLRVNNNMFVENKPDFAFGVAVKSESTLLPTQSSFTNNTVYKISNNEVVSNNDKCKGFDDFTFHNNTVYAKNIGNFKNDGVDVYDPSNADDLEICILCYGVNEDTGPQWNYMEPEKTELGVDPESYIETTLNKMKNNYNF